MNRNSLSPAFTVDPPHAFVDAYVMDGLPADLDQFVDPEIAAVVEAAADHEVGYRVHAVDAGRGASGPGLALEIIGHVSNVGGALGFGVLGAQTLRGIYRRLRAKTKVRQVTKGAAIQLAIAELSDHIQDLDPAVAFAVDLTADPFHGTPSDQSMTGVDQFLIGIAHGPHVYCFLVDPNGDVQHVGRGLRTPGWMAEVMPPKSGTEPGWYADPTGRTALRWWDGQWWTDRVTTDGVESVDPFRP